jgi:hypothetical protein
MIFSISIAPPSHFSKSEKSLRSLLLLGIDQGQMGACGAAADRLNVTSHTQDFESSPAFLTVVLKDELIKSAPTDGTNKMKKPGA